MLVDYQIEEMIRLYNMVQPFEPELLNPASLDIRIGNSIVVEDVTRQKETKTIDIRHFSEANPYWVEPMGWLLAGSLETFNLPPIVAAEFKLKSSRAREGWGHSLAGHCDPGWHGSVLTMELKNYRQFSALPLFPGLKMGQMIFHLTSTPTQHYGETGRYNGDRSVSPSKSLIA
jgi:dCTP deaminase